MSKKIIVFDVDGVIIDSTEECLVIAYNAHLKFSKSGHKPIESPDEAPTEYAIRFREIRKYVKSMDEYLSVFNSIEHDISGQADYEKILSSLDSNEANSFGQFFFDQRVAFKERKRDEWLQLHTVYSGIRDALAYAIRESKVYIVTGKDRDSVLDILQYLNLEIPSQNIFDKYSAKNKMACLSKIADQERVPLWDVFFLDDNVTHLMQPIQSGMHVMLAEWGYGTPEHFEIAKQIGVPIVKLKDLEMAIRAFLAS